MRKFIKEIGVFARTINSNFLLVPQNAPHVMMLNDSYDLTEVQIDSSYMNTINAWRIEDLNYGELLKRIYMS
jgi:hypothetical protein